MDSLTLLSQGLIRLSHLVLLVLTVSGCSWIQLVSVNSAEVQGDSYSQHASASADGRYVAFASNASNLVVGDTNTVSDIFVRDTLAGTTTRISVDSAEAQGNGSSYQPAISAGGRYVAFRSSASNLVAGDTNSVSDIFVRDTQAGTTTRVSVDSAEVQGNNGNSQHLAISADGHYVAFSSQASNLVAGDTNDRYDVFVRDTLAGTTTRVSVSSAEAQGNAASDGRPSISADGRYVAFNSDASNLVAGDTNDRRDVFVRDTVDGTTTRISVDDAEVQGNDTSYDPSISVDDGRYVAFRSVASNLVAGDTNDREDVFVRDTLDGTTTRVSVDSAEAQGNDYSTDPSISADGRYVAFRSRASNLVAGDTNDISDIFIRDTVAGTTTRVSLDRFGVEGLGGSYQPSISADGRYVAFETIAANLVPNDLNGVYDIAIKAIPQITLTSVVPQMLPIGFKTQVTLTGSNFLPGTVPDIDGADVSNVVIVNESTITMDATVPAGEVAGARNVVILLYGTGPGQYKGSSGICNNCVTLF